MNYEEAVTYLYGLGKFATRPGLHRMADILQQLGNPHQRLRVIHVARTNGKGSTCCYLARALQTESRKVGLFTSPHLQIIRERIQINGEMISEAEFANKTTVVRRIAESQVRRGREHPTYFELLTAIMFTYFVEQKVDVAVLEVGLGGKYDATNIVSSPEAVAITPVGLDHVKVLGDTLPEIAREKAGIMKANTRATVWGNNEEVMRVYSKKADIEGIPITRVTECIDGNESPCFRIGRLCRGGSEFSYSGSVWEYESCTLSMLGYHQVINASIALSTLEQLHLADSSLKVSSQQAKQRLAEARWPGRLEKILESPDVILDGAHNESAVQMLASTVRQLYPDTVVHCVVGVLKDKNAQKMLRIFQPVIGGNVVTTSCPSPMKMEARVLGNVAKEVFPSDRQISIIDDSNDALRFCVDNAADDDLIVVWGSLYLVGAVREAYLAEEVN